MALPVTLRTLKFWTLAISSAAGIVGISAGQIYELTNPTAHRTLASEGYSFDPATFSFFPEDQEIIGRVLSYGSSDRCFGHMFGQTHKINISDESYNTPAFFNDESDLKAVPAPTDQSPDTSLDGCLMMEMNNRYSSDSEAAKMAFKSELAIRSGNVGGALWAAGEYAKGQTEHVHRFEYTLMLMEKSEDSWSIKVGYSGFDKGAHLTSTNTSPTMIIASPEEGWLNGDYPKHNMHKKYFGIWTESNGSEILQNIRLHAKGSVGAEILGMNGSNFDLDNAGYKRVQSEYRPSPNSGGQYYRAKQNDKNWSGEDISKTLAKGYKPFAGKRGSWRKLTDYCLDMSLTRNISRDDVVYEHLINWCYSRSQNNVE